MVARNSPNGRALTWWEEWSMLPMLLVMLPILIPFICIVLLFETLMPETFNKFDKFQLKLSR